MTKFEEFLNKQKDLSENNIYIKSDNGNPEYFAKIAWDNCKHEVLDILKRHTRASFGWTDMIEAVREIQNL